MSHTLHVVIIFCMYFIIYYNRYALSEKNVGYLRFAN